MDTVSEAEIGDACREGRLLDCASAGSRRAVDASVLRRLCQGRTRLTRAGSSCGMLLLWAALIWRGMDVQFPVRLDAVVVRSGHQQMQREIAEGFRGCL